ncbi:hypothetical protein Sme01_44470 [Sphaerisporangium melleum]|uniref:Uncharacterized protein n=1 Tax=Sphaerisporangium melleum TaxID=321316 RepID=A0A917VIB6_9ACTN|nr:hypothetical protein GCM10007964_24640 [Sphaerisporangium melleum]GII71971.1 hypothetical protein Sme01_44470 [Sphaerisporangium melleum]
MCWTVSRPTGTLPAIADVAGLLSRSGDFTVQELDIAEGPLGYEQEAVVFFEMANDGFFLFQSPGSYIGESPILRSLSLAGCSWNVTWTGSLYASHFSYAETGGIVFTWKGFAGHHAPKPQILEPALTEVEAVYQECQASSIPFDLAAMMAAVDLMSGQGFPLNWAEGARPALIISDPLPRSA